MDIPRFQLPDEEDPAGTCCACCEDYYAGEEQDCPTCGETIHKRCVEPCEEDDCREQGCKLCMPEGFCGIDCMKSYQEM